VLEAAWRAQPHPDLAESYAHLRSGDSARERLARVQSLVRARPNHVESAFAIARAALDAQEFAAARAALAPLAAAPTQRAAMLMAELEEMQHGDVGRAREWMGRALRAPRDAAWVADGIVSDQWMPLSPVTGRLDAFEWKPPPGEPPPTLPALPERLIEQQREAAPPEERAGAAAAAAGAAVTGAEPAPTRAAAIV
jgi:HemY protein